LKVHLFFFKTGAGYSSYLGDPEIKICKFGPSHHKSYKIKEEYQSDYAREEEKNKKMDALIDKIEELGGEIGEDFAYNTFNFPQEFYEIDEESYKYTYAKIEFMCHEGTKFYQIMKENNILDKNYPK
jgi:hypothetical protein